MYSLKGMGRIWGNSSFSCGEAGVSTVKRRRRLDWGPQMRGLHGWDGDGEGKRDPGLGKGAFVKYQVCGGSPL